MPEISIILPAYNESARITPTLTAWAQVLAGRDAELIVASDGSRDDTVAVVTSYAREHPWIRVMDLQPNRGKGAAVRDGILAAAGDFRFYADADGGIAPGNLDRLLIPLRAGSDLAIAQRDLAEYARAERSPARVAAGAAVQVTRRALLLPTIADTQAGFKGLRATAADAIFSRAVIDGFAFDVEVLYLARRLGLTISPVPVAVTFQPDSTYSVRRHLPPFLRDIWRVRRRAWARDYDLG